MPRPSPPDRLYTPDEAALLISPSGEVSPKALTNALRRGELTGVKVSGRWFVTWHDIKGWLTSCRKNRRGHASTSGENAGEPRSGPSATGRMKRAQVAASTIAQELTKLSPRTSNAAINSARRAGRTR